jgi:Fe-S-cluster containining protein
VPNPKYEKLDKIYSKLPTIKCKGDCASSCSYIPVGKLEIERITKWLGFNPFPPLDEKMINDVMDGQMDLISYQCPLLKEGKCTIYKIRPLICRLFGLTKKMRCPFGCVPSKWLDDAVAKKLLIKAKYY